MPCIPQTLHSFLISFSHIFFYPIFPSYRWSSNYTCSINFTLIYFFFFGNSLPCILFTCPSHLNVFYFTHSITPQSTSLAFSDLPNLSYTLSFLSPLYRVMPHALLSQLIPLPGFSTYELQSVSLLHMERLIQG